MRFFTLVSSDPLVTVLIIRRAIGLELISQMPMERALNMMTVGIMRIGMVSGLDILLISNLNHFGAPKVTKYIMKH